MDTRTHGPLRSISDAGGYLGVSSQTVRRMIKEHRINAVKVRGRVLVPYSELQRVAQHGC